MACKVGYFFTLNLTYGVRKGQTMRVDIKGASTLTGLTEYAIRKLIWAKKIPYFTTGGGKYIFDEELLDDAIRNIMLNNMEVPR